MREYVCISVLKRMSVKKNKEAEEEGLNVF